jgi:hypothetical protein
MAKARKASITQSKLGFIFYGEQFTGKSTMAMQLAYFRRPDGKPFRILYLDPETGSIDDYLGDLENSGVNLENIYIVYTQALGEVREYIAKVKNNEDFYVLEEETGEETDEVVLDADGEPFRADAIVVDGTTILNLTTKQGFVEFSKKRNKVKADKAGMIGDERLVKIEGSGIELKDYQTINFKGQDLVLDLMASGAHYAITARETDEKESIKQADGTTTSVNTGRKIPDGFKGMTYNVKTEIRMFRNEDGTVCAHVKKDRTHVHEDNITIEDPTLIDWQEVINKTADKKAFIVKNDLTKAVDVEQNIYRKEILGEVGRPIVDEREEDCNMEDLESLKKEILAKKNSLPANKKAALKGKLEENGLPIAFKNVTDIDVLKKVLVVMEE